MLDNVSTWMPYQLRYASDEKSNLHLHVKKRNAAFDNRVRMRPGIYIPGNLSVPVFSYGTSLIK